MRNKMMRSARVGIFAALCLLGSVAATPAFASGAIIQDVSYAGTGCPAGTTAISIASAHKRMTLVFDAATAATGPGMVADAATRGCQVALSLQVPAGTATTHALVTLRGYLGAPEDVSGSIGITTGLDGEAPADEHAETRSGPTHDDYLIARDVVLQTGAASDGVRTLDIALQIELPAGGAAALLAIDALDVALDPENDENPEPTLTVEEAGSPLTLVSVQPSVLPNEDGWTTSDVTVSFECKPPTGFTVDAERSSLDPITLTASGNAAGTCVATDASGNVSSGTSTYTARLDKNPPTITVTSPVSGGIYELGAAVTPEVACSDADSGVASCDFPSAVDTTTPGEHSYIVSASDRAGNSTQLTVNYRVARDKNDCKQGGWRRFVVPTFRNQGQCVSSFVP